MIAFISIILFSGIACNMVGTPTQQAQTMAPPTDKVDAFPTSSNLDNWVTFSDQNNSYKIDLPKDWVTGHSDEKDYNYYIDQFQPPDLKELLEVFVFDDGKPFKDGDDKYIYALSVLKSLYAKDVEVANRNVEPNGRETLIWKSKTDEFISIFEVKNKTSFVMLTVLGYATEEQYPEVVNKIVASFVIQYDPLPEDTGSFEYSSVAEALADLKTKEGVKINVSQGWTIITEANGLTMWSFAPSDNPAYPAVAKRVFYEDQNGWFVTMNIHCEADKAACDQFVRDFEKLNEDMRKYIEKDQLRKYLEQLQGNNP